MLVHEFRFLNSWSFYFTCLVTGFFKSIVYLFIYLLLLQVIVYVYVFLNIELPYLFCSLLLRLRLLQLAQWIHSSSIVINHWCSSTSFYLDLVLSCSHFWSLHSSPEQRQLLQLAPFLFLEPSFLITLSMTRLSLCQYSYYLKFILVYST